MTRLHDTRSIRAEITELRSSIASLHSARQASPSATFGAGLLSWSINRKERRLDALVQKLEQVESKNHSA
jgi:hypothetical protein